MLGWRCGPCRVQCAGTMHSRCSSLCHSNAAIIIPGTHTRKPAQDLSCCLQLVGYYGAALSVDYRWLGRKKLTSFSFLWVSLCSARLLSMALSAFLALTAC